MTISLAAPPSITPPLPERPTRRALRGRVAPALSGWSRDGAEWPSVFLAVSGDTQTWSGGDIENWSAQAGGTIRKIRTRPDEAGDGADGRGGCLVGVCRLAGGTLRRIRTRRYVRQPSRQDRGHAPCNVGRPGGRCLPHPWHRGRRRVAFDVSRSDPYNVGRTGAGGACLARATAGKAEWISIFRAATHTTWDGPVRAAPASPVSPQRQAG